jgi:hypothetical protein
MTSSSARSARPAGVALAITGLIVLLLSFVEWGMCPTTPCGGPFMAFSEYTGVDLGFGVVTAFAGMLLVGIGLDSVLGRVAHFDRLAAGLALVVVAAATASVVWMYGLPSEPQDPNTFLADGFSPPLGTALLIATDFLGPPYTAIAVALVGLLALAAALWLRRSRRSAGLTRGSHQRRLI